MSYVEDLRKLIGHRPLIFFGSVVIILDSSGRILLQKRSSYPVATWGLPGGLMELGESAEETARVKLLWITSNLLTLRFIVLIN